VRNAEGALRSPELALGLLLSLLILAVNIASVSSHLGLVHRPRQVKELDHSRYIEMAKGAEGRAELAREATYAWRILVPALAGGLTRAGLNIHQAFYLVTNVSLLAFLLTFWLYLGELAFARPWRVTGLLLVGLTQGAVRWYEYQYWMTDPPCLFLLVLAFLLIERGRRRLLHVPSLLAAFVRENYVVFYPYDFLKQLKRGTPILTAFARTAAVAAVPLAILVALRVFIETNHPDDIVAGVVDTLGFRWRHLADNQLYVLTVGSLGVLFPLLVLFPRRLRDWVRRHYDEAAVVAFFYGVLIIANNTERELAYTLPALVPAALRNLRDAVDETGLPATPILALVVGLQAFFLSQQRFLEAGMSMYQPTNLAVAAAMAAFWLGIEITLRRSRRRLRHAGSP
jgi:hypothetical protein